MSMRTLKSALLGGALALASPASPAPAQEKPQYGGTLEIGTVYVTLSALSFDPADWNWKHNHDTGQFYEQLFAADLSQEQAGTAASIPSVPTPGCRPTRSAASWPRAGSGSENPLRVEIKLRKGVMFPEKPGVMKKRELTAEDIVFSLQPPRARARRRSRATSTTSRRSRRPTSTPSSSPSSTSTPSGITASAGATTRRSTPKEVADAGATNWKNVNGTGPFMLTDFVSGQFQHLHEEPGSTGTRRRSAAASTSCRSSTRSSIAPSRTRRPSSPRCAPASSTSWRRSAGRTSTR